MVDFTRQIKQARDTASSTPKFAAPSSSLGGDVVNAIGTGLQFYQQQQAKVELQNLTKAESAQERMAANAFLELKQYREDVTNQTGMTPHKVTMGERRLMSKYPPEMIRAVYKEVNTTTKRTSKSVADEVEANIEKRENLLQTGVVYAATVKDISQEQLTSATDEQKEEWAKESSVFNAQIQQQKAIAEVSEDATAPFVNAARLVLQKKVDTHLSTIREAQRSGNIQDAQEAGNKLRTMMQDAVQNAPTRIREMTDAVGKGAFYDAGLVTAYTQEISKIMSDPNVKDLLLGKEINTESTNSAKALVNVSMSKTMFDVIGKIKSGENTADNINDLKNLTEHFFNSTLSGVNFSKNTEGTLKRALGIEASAFDTPNNSDEKTTDNAGLLFKALNKIITVLDSSDTSTIKEVNTITSEYINAKLDSDKPLTDSDMNWVVKSLGYGENGTTDERGKGASKAVLDAPLSLLSRPDYKEKIQPLVEKVEEKGVDVSSILTNSLKKHIRNNAGNAYRNLVTLGTSGETLGKGTAIRGDRSRPALEQEVYNLKDVVHLTNQNGRLKFKYKAGMLGQSTDVRKIQQLASLDKTAVVLNKYITAMSNVNDTDANDIAYDMMLLLKSELGVNVEGLD